MRASAMSILAAAAAGALTSYFLDPYQGARRRAVVRDKIFSRISNLDDAGRVAAVDLRNRVQGTFAAVRQRATTEDVPDDVLAERVRARLGRVVSHPGSIEVRASQGTVTLQGPVLKRELQRLIRTVSAVPGVHEVLDRLEAHKQQGNISGLQGGHPREQRIDILQEHWAPATRIVVGGAGALLCALARRSPAAPFLMAGGIALLVRAGTNMDAKRLLGQRGRMGIEFIKTLQIAAPVDEVFAFWSDFENFPRFMRNVRAVYKNRDGSWHWEVAGPLGTTVRWDASVTASIPNELVAWATTPGSQVQHAGIVRFQEENGATRIQVEMSYNPPAAALGHLVASLFGADPASEMDEDLMRLKSYFETGKPARDAAQPPALG